MKMTPLAAGGGVNAINPNEGNSASPTRLERAKAVAAGITPEEKTPTLDAQVSRTQNAMKRIKMKTQVSQNRHELIEAPEATETVVEAAPPVENVDTLAPTEPATATSEETKPLSPQFAALAKQKRALQLKEQELLAKEKAFETNSSGTKSLEEYRARIKANALKVLQEEGVTYDQLTEQILASNENEGVAALEAKIKALEEGIDKKLSERDRSAEAQVFAQMQNEATQLISQGDEFESIREAGYLPEVMRLIKTDWEKNQYVWDVREACQAVEDGLIEDALKWAKLKKVQGQLNPAPAAKEQTPVKQDRPNTKIMRTLTNRDGSSSTTLSKRERAIAAMEGRLK